MIEKINRLYRIWCNMRFRCNKEYNTHYDLYGGRGIKVCQEWDNLNDGFQNFEKWAKQSGYSDDLTIDRINNDGNYEPDNCRWVNMVVQSRNKRNSRIVTFNGETLHIKDMAEKHNIPANVAENRYQKGWSIEKIFSTPYKKPFERTVNYKGEEVTLRQLSEITGIKLNTIKTRYQRGFSVERMISEVKAR